jgi:hypothetical protein
VRLQVGQDQLVAGADAHGVGGIDVGGAGQGVATYLS